MSDRLIQQHLLELSDLAKAVAQQMHELIAEVAELTHATITAGGKLMFCGNGGSAADSQHLATEYVVRFRRNRRPVAALALTTDTSLLTAAGNDFGFDQIFSRQVEALGRPGDLLFLHSTSGESRNLLQAAAAARTAGVTTVAMLGNAGGALADKVDHPVVVPTRNGAHAQELHLAIGHIICDLVESRLAVAAQ